MSKLPRNTLKTRHGPGVWSDAEGGLHFSIPELLKHFGLPDTDENQLQMQAIIREIIREKMPGTPITERDTQDT